MANTWQTTNPFLLLFRTATHPFSSQYILTHDLISGGTPAAPHQKTKNRGSPFGLLSFLILFSYPLLLPFHFL
ncbi:hypothetical protein RchiOBHm_Chr1g0361021 [Rosa chinensis]|uniref:Uncharacterized protein n=1 Tax=Rosa chinensis TaxID=74649 RepID=A0A2P6SIV0_ROSCH|nr:hypothetical protein RchiOBHm_Chr1g0361021 [Rosa chinensis]